MKTIKLKSADLRFVLAMVITTIIVVTSSMAVNAEGFVQKSKGIIKFENGIKFDASDIDTLNKNIEALEAHCK